MIHSFVLSGGQLVQQNPDLEALRAARGEKGRMLWIDLDNPTDAEAREILESLFAFHPVAIEDCLTPSYLPKIEDYEEYLFIVVHAVDFTADRKFVNAELDLFLGRDYLVTFHRAPLKSLAAVRERLAKNTPGPVRDADRLAHSVLDQLVDNYQPTLDALRAELEEIEDAVLTRGAGPNFNADIVRVRRECSTLQRIVGPQREVVERLAHGESKLIRTATVPYFRNLRDNLRRIEGTTASDHDRLLMAFDIHLNKAAFEANEGIKFLTALTAITLPAVVVGGWYGMNFANMPELHTTHGYLCACLGTAATTLLMAWYLRRKRWF